MPPGPSGHGARSTSPTLNVGAYGLFHIGHLNILRRAREHCDFLIAGVVSDEMLEQSKGTRPFVPLAERLRS